MAEERGLVSLVGLSANQRARSLFVATIMSVDTSEWSPFEVTLFGGKVHRKSFPTVFYRGITMFYPVKYRSFHTPLGYKHLKSVLNNSMSFLK